MRNKTSLNKGWSLLIASLFVFISLAVSVSAETGFVSVCLGGVENG